MATHIAREDKNYCILSDHNKDNNNEDDNSKDSITI